jgi:hypothetical protein
LLAQVPLAWLPTGSTIVSTPALQAAVAALITVRACGTETSLRADA